MFGLHPCLVFIVTLAYNNLHQLFFLPPLTIYTLQFTFSILTSISCLPLSCFPSFLIFLPLTHLLTQSPTHILSLLITFTSPPTTFIQHKLPYNFIFPPSLFPNTPSFPHSLTRTHTNSLTHSVSHAHTSSTDHNYATCIALIYWLSHPELVTHKWLDYLQVWTATINGTRMCIMSDSLPSAYTACIFLA